METMQQFHGVDFTQVANFCIFGFLTLVATAVALKRWIG